MMKQMNRSKVQKQFTQILHSYHFLEKIIPPSSIETFNDFVQALSNETLSFNNSSPLSSKTEKVLKIEILLEILEKQQDDVTLNLIVKKIILIFMIIRRLVQEEMMSEDFQKLFERQINKILKEDVAKLINPKQKRASSISKIYGYIRELSGSKEKYNLQTGRTQLESQNEKGALKEIISQIIEPFCLYLLKILQNNEFYFSIFRRNTMKQSRSSRWKMINYSKILGQIVYQLYRFGRYFVNDLMGMLIYLTLLSSKDLAIYYDILREEVEGECGELKKKILERESKALRNFELEAEQPNVGEYTELKDYIQEILSIKQKIHYIFGNKALKNYRYYFSKPARYNLKDQTGIDSFEFVLDYYKKTQKLQHRSESLINIDFSNDSCLLTKSQAIYSRELFRSKEEMHMQDQSTPAANKPVEISSSDLQYSIVSPCSAKPRRQNWMNRIERNKQLFLNAAIDKQDLISTNGNE